MRQLRYAIRVLARQWGFSLVAIAILALCLGANVAVLSAIDALLLRPLPYPGQDRLAALVRVSPDPDAGGVGESHSGATWEVVRERVPEVAFAISSGGSTGVNLALGSTARYVDQHRVGAGYFAVLGIRPALGREFSGEEDRPAGPRVALLSHTLWQRAFGGDPTIVGRAMFLRGEPYTVVGVLPAGFRPLVPADVWTPLRPARTGEGGGTNYTIIARLPATTSWVATNDRLSALSREVAREQGIDPGRAPRLQVIPLLEGQTMGLRQPLWLLWAAVAAVFVIGCVNVGGMLLARSTARAGEMATRLALGAHPRHIVGQLLVESVVLSASGGLAAVGVGWVMLAMLRRAGVDAFPALEPVTLDWRVLAMAAGLALVGTLLVGVLPAWQASRVDLRAAQGTRTVAGRRGFASMGLLVGGQVALTVPLLVGAGLLLRTLVALWTLDPGFNPDRLLAARFSLQDARYADAAAVQRLVRETTTRLARLPGVNGAAVSLSMPYERALNLPFRLSADSAAPMRIANMSYVSPGYFDVLQAPLRAGRALTDADTATSGRVAVVNEAFARMYFGVDGALGRTIWLGQSAPVQIVGVVGSVQQRRAGWGNFGPVAAVPTFYVPVAQMEARSLTLAHTWFSPSWVVRAAGPEAQVRAGIEEAVRAVDPMLPIAGFRTMADLKRASLSEQRFLALLVGLLGALALLLAALGLLGLLSNMVAERTRELGIRLALGSTRLHAVRSAVTPALLWLAAGAAAGTLLVPAATGLVESFLWGVRPADPTTLAATAAGLLVVALVATASPALRIVRLDPARTLRDG